jgi:hypothetical protein
MGRIFCLNLAIDLVIVFIVLEKNTFDLNIIVCIFFPIIFKQFLKLNFTLSLLFPYFILVASSKNLAKFIKTK